MGSGGGGYVSRSSRGSGLPTGTSGRPKGAGGGGGGADIPDQCDFQFEADLSAVDSDVAAQLSVGDILSVALIKRQTYDVAICRDRRGGIVGTVTNTAELGELITCLKSGAAYSAEVRDVSATHCTVFIERQL